MFFQSFELTIQPQPQPQMRPTQLLQVFLVSLVFLLFTFQADAQTDKKYQLQVISQPANTPANAELYAAGNFNNWIAGDRMYQLHPNSEGVYTLQISTPLDTLIYKYTRGTWPSVEGDDFGQIKKNRQLLHTGNAITTVEDEIKTWEDLESSDTYTFVIESLPENTPIDATIYLTGNFNRWEPGNPDYKFSKLEDNTYTYTLKGAPDHLEYKFTRGTWETVEGGSDGRAIGNRQYRRTEGGPVMLYATIKTWEDFSGSKVNYYDFILIIASVIAFLLLVAFNWMVNANVQANRFLSLALALFIITSAARILMNYRQMFHWEPRLVLLPDMVYFTIAPLLYFYFQSLLAVRPRISMSKWISFIPAGILMLTYIPLFVLDRETFIDKMVNREFHWLFALTAGIGLIYNFIYWLKSLRVLKIYTEKMDNTQSFDQSHYYLNSLLTLYSICLFTWLATYLIGGAGLFGEMDTIRITDTTSDLTWILFAGTPFLVAYFALSQPELFRISETSEKYRFSSLSDESVNNLKEQLHQLMLNEKPFLNPKLTLLELAEMIETNTHALSRVINEGFDRNFYDFVNFYRVEEFKRLVNQADHKNLTFLAIAYEVGFSSKTTFNRAFKKLEGHTPREYHKQMIHEGTTEEMKWV